MDQADQAQLTAGNIQRQFSRDEIRAAILGAKPLRKTINAFGIQVDIVQPPAGEVMQQRDKEQVVAWMIINYCFVPGTDEKVFDAADVDGLMSVPFNQDYVDISKEITSMVNIEEVMKGQGKDSAKTPSSS